MRSLLGIAMRRPFQTKDNEFIAWYPLGLIREAAQEVWARRRIAYYVHIPFCTAICDYCGFSVEALKHVNVQRYLHALRTEIERYRDSGRLTSQRFVCGHLGGGTPSVLAAKDLVAIK